MSADGPVAAVDCGTNSTRLLVTDGPGRTRQRLMTITRLGEGVGRTGRLQPEAIDRTLEALRGYRKVLDDHAVTDLRASATSAARDAANRDDFLDGAEAVLGTRPELLSGAEEARLSFAGAVADLDPADGPFLVVDIGGGSTEFAVGGREATGALSIDVGCVRMTELYLHHDPPTPTELSQLLSVVRSHLDDVARELPEASTAPCLVGLAGTVTTVAAVELGLAAYDPERIHHFPLTRAAAEDVFRTLATEPRAARIHNPGLEEARADVIVAGAAILVAVLRYFDADACLVSEADILDGLAAGLLGGR